MNRIARRLPWQLRFIMPSAVLLVAFAIYPIADLLRMSVSDVTTATITKEWPFIGLRNFGEVVPTPPFQQAVVNSAVFTTIVVVLGLAGGFVVAHALRSGGRLTTIAMPLLLIAWLAPPVACGLVWKFLLAGDGVFNSLLAPLFDKPILFLVEGWLPLLSVAFVTAWVTVPFAAIILRSAMLDIPREVLEQASVDGASSRQSLQYVTLPLLRPTILVLGSLIVVYAFRSFDFIYVMTVGGPGTASTTLPFYGYRLFFSALRFGPGAAVAAISIGIVAIMALTYMRAARSGSR